MITLGRAAFQSELRFNEYYGLSTDHKPTLVLDGVTIPNGSTLYYMDNQTTFMYDAENNVNVSNSKAFSVAAGNTDSVNSFSVEFDSDERTITMDNSSSTEAVLGQYFGYNQ